MYQRLHHSLTSLNVPTLSDTALSAASMGYASGSVVFLVEKAQYQVPKSLLQQYGGALSDMLSFNDSKDENISLDDSTEAFKEFYLVLHRPFDSCLYPGNPASSNLFKVLSLLRIAHKYCVDPIEAKARKLATSLTSRKTFRNHVTPELSSIRILEIALETKSHSMTAVARDVVMEDLIRPTKLSHFEVLALGERLGDQGFAAFALYKIMLRGPAVHRRLAGHNLARIKVGMLNCVRAWDNIANAWGKTGNIPPSQSAICGMCGGSYGHRTPPDLLHDVWARHGQKNISSYDVLGKLDTVLEIPRLCEKVCATVRTERAKVESSLASFFFCEETV